MPQLVLLDVGLPDEDGFTLARWLQYGRPRGRPGVPVPTTTSPNLLSSRQLLARVKSVLRRVRSEAPPSVGEVRYVLSTDDAGSAEFALAVTPDWQGLGLARALLARLSGHAAATGVRRLVADTLAGNAAMLELVRAAGFTVSGNGVDRRLLRLVKELSPRAQRRPLQRFALPAQAELHCSQGG